MIAKTVTLALALMRYNLVPRPDHYIPANNIKSLGVCRSRTPNHRATERSPSSSLLHIHGLSACHKQQYVADLIFQQTDTNDRQALHVPKSNVSLRLIAPQRSQQQPQSHAKTKSVPSPQHELSLESHSAQPVLVWDVSRPQQLR